MTESGASRILVRATRPDAVASAFARRLSRLSGLPAALVADGRHATGYHDELPMISLTEGACRALGLYCPEDFAWRCGDYGYYLARERFPDAQHFWMIETDVYFSADAERFFAFFAPLSQVDFLAAQLRPADPSWYWMANAAARNVRPFRCLFPVTRLSARAIDATLRQRRLHSRRVLRRQLWPNDEALVATTLINNGFECRDFNDFGLRFYLADTFSHWKPLDGGRLPDPQGVCMMHPVATGAAYSAKLDSRRFRHRSFFERAWRKTVWNLNGRLRQW
jgi:hypothetical protein